jgi:hypothetical protein
VIRERTLDNPGHVLLPDTKLGQRFWNAESAVERLQLAGNIGAPAQS